jgi:hypothetical protein
LRPIPCCRDGSNNDWGYRMAVRAIGPAPDPFEEFKKAPNVTTAESIHPAKQSGPCNETYKVLDPKAELRADPSPDAGL